MWTSYTQLFRAMISLAPSSLDIQLLMQRIAERVDDHDNFLSSLKVL